LVAVLLSLVLPASASAETFIDDPSPTEGSTINNPTPTFEFHSDSVVPPTFECTVGDLTIPDCTSPHTIAPALADGTYTFSVQAFLLVAPDGDPVTRTFTVDATPPGAPVVTGPSGPTSDNDPSFDFSSEGGVTFECALDGPGGATGTFSSCSSGKQYSNRDDGDYTFRVRATDEAGNVGPAATRTFTVDTKDPDTRIDTGPTGTTPDNTPTFTFSSPDEPGAATAFECRIDDDDFGPCSGPGDTYTPAALADGVHIFEVRAVDAAGNRDPNPAIRHFTVDTSLPPDTTPPDLEITKQPKGKIKTRKKAARVKVSFSSEPGATYKCKLDGAEYEPCSSPYRVKAKAGAGKGKKHAISVQAADEAGNVGEPAVVRFKVLRKLRLQAPVARRTVTTALKRHDFARRVVKSVDIGCSRRSQVVFACRFSTRFSGYRLKGKGKITLRKNLSYRFRVVAQGVHFTLTDENEQRSH
jgi:hypothetical protein